MPQLYDPLRPPTGRPFRIGNAKRPSVQELGQRLSNRRIEGLPRRSCPDRVRGSVLDRGEVLGDLRPVTQRGAKPEVCLPGAVYIVAVGGIRLGLCAGWHCGESYKVGLHLRPLRGILLGGDG